MAKKKKSVYQRIVEAVRKGKGLRLSAEEVNKLGLFDHAIMERARSEQEGTAEDMEEQDE